MTAWEFRTACGRKVGERPYPLHQDQSGLAIIWNASDGQQVLTIRHADYGSVRGVAFSPDGHYIVTGGENAEAKIWKVTLPDY